MKRFYQEIIAILKTIKGIQDVQIWNNQIEKLEFGSIESIPLPALFVEVLNGYEIQQLQMGVQFYDNVVVRVHLLHEHYDSGNGLMAQNYDVFDLMNLVYLKLHMKVVTDSGFFVRTNQEQDIDHNNLYHAVIDFTTTLIDNNRSEPFNEATQSTNTTSAIVNLDLTTIYQ